MNTTELAMTDNAIKLGSCYAYSAEYREMRPEQDLSAIVEVFDVRRSGGVYEYRVADVLESGLDWGTVRTVWAEDLAPVHGGR